MAHGGRFQCENFHIYLPSFIFFYTVHQLVAKYLRYSVDMLRTSLYFFTLFLSFH